MRMYKPKEKNLVKLQKFLNGYNLRRQTDKPNLSGATKDHR